MIDPDVGNAKTLTVLHSISNGQAPISHLHPPKSVDGYSELLRVHTSGPLIGSSSLSGAFEPQYPAGSLSQVGSPLRAGAHTARAPRPHAFPDRRLANPLELTPVLRRRLAQGVLRLRKLRL
eukprot:CAMPEP_0113275790 /NCGR_PEP_ID=MMETSP0008_2-20120614/25142_1 /TAXON_ID=97485 /ORGANISM="Prymnesium parvum" /LENGTH=121 /DNA_ID=CAMNT_0000125537 /DNA_START=54 /DNA_END=417 /DNA_ORIENTATION=+ /assembly_acc=CAM_ASM_000153